MAHAAPLSARLAGSHFRLVLLAGLRQGNATWGASSPGSDVPQFG
jgi:hypothetical protein